MRKIVKFEDRRTWPKNLRQAVDKRNLDDIHDILSNISLLGYHCSRLCEDEIKRICEHGFKKPSVQFFEHRIQYRVEHGDLTPEDAEILLRDNEVHQRYQSNTPQFSATISAFRQGGSTRLFSYWGGEALYVCHETASVGATLSRIGQPVVVVVCIPIKEINYPDSIAENFLDKRGFDISVADNIDAQNIMRIIRQGDSDFELFI